jgi:ATP-dependent helicase YprA (DUF1998 family)
MDPFRLRSNLISAYSSYIRSFIRIQDERIGQHVEENLESGLLWPEPLIQMNPSFEPGEWIDELVETGLLHGECTKIFRSKPSMKSMGSPLRLYKHQSDAVRAARSGANYVLTTGTGSGKSLAYIVPIVDHALRSGKGGGIKAIVVYPMNALANSQYGELTKFLCHGYPDGKGPVTFERYTGQESDEKRNEITANPPDILLTNFVMLELILTRVHEKPLIEAAQGLRFLVLDELHTYRGRQGADVALLVRRVKETMAAKDLQCIGTSATLATGGSYDEQRIEIARVSSILFGAEVNPENIIGETLRRATPDIDLSSESFVSDLTRRIKDPSQVPPKDYESFVNDPLSIWLESTFGVEKENGTGRLIRKQPRSITGHDGAAEILSTLTGLTERKCLEAVEQGLLGGYSCEVNPESGFPPFAFRLHQFISRGDTVYASLEHEDVRFVTVQGQQFVPGDRSKILLPLVFCRECGQEYYCVRKGSDPENGTESVAPRELSDQFRDQDSQPGFLYYSESNPWPSDFDELYERLPDDWFEEVRGVTKVRKSRKDYLPRSLWVNTLGQISSSGAEYQYIRAPFRFCLNCGVAYGTRERSDFGKLTTLGSEGRSTATTILCLSLIRSIRNQKSLPERARKLLSFTDNRQDASLQAGHFNDFIEISLLRSALCSAVSQSNVDGLRYDELTQRVFSALRLPIDQYAMDPDVRFQAKEETDRALRDVIGYRLYRDLRRGWRVTSPNLEQCGLLEIGYLSLEELCEADDVWKNSHPALVNSSPELRIRVSKVLLDYMRRELAIMVDYLNPQTQESIQQRSSQRLRSPWGLDENERLEHSAIVYPRSRVKKDYQGNVFLSARGGFGQYLRRSSTFPDYSGGFKLEETQEIIGQLLECLRVAGLVAVVHEPKDESSVPGYQLAASSMLWKAGEGTKSFHDPIRVPHRPEFGGKTNPFFVEYYKTVASEVQGIRAREHTAQVPMHLRIEREEDFREARLPILFCSPTMELGVDIKELNAVNLRNVPPTPANYAQRSGRAGRSGQPALVFSYCAVGSPHDQYFFKRPWLMVSGAVSPPRLDLANEDLIKAHVHALWLSVVGLSLGTSLKDILDLSNPDKHLPLLPGVKDSVDYSNARQMASDRAERVLGTVRHELESADWYSKGWLHETISQIGISFDCACERWRSLYLSALRQAKAQSAIIQDASRSPQDKAEAKRLRREAERQLELLTDNQNVVQSDFYSYRYFASEGFLPGYNFPRLPLSAYIPGSARKQDREEFLSRPRFLAISEFGPRAFIYHEGSRYIISKAILPAGTEEILTTSAKLCPSCGFLHQVSEPPGPDLCERCGCMLDPPLSQLFRLQNVSTTRRDKISSDEEERLRLGYELRSSVRFAKYDGQLSCRTAEVKVKGKRIAELTYGDAAVIWRINLGWARRKNKAQLGFVLDTERGYWSKNDQLEPDENEVLGNRTARVIPYVEDRKNCLLFKPENALSQDAFVSLQSALKNAIQVCYQLEDSELAAEPLPTREDMRLILFYEASEGGAGVLRRLINESDALGEVAKEALRLCHFDPETGEDLRKAPESREDCEAACYDCLMSYGNQRDHSRLDRQAIKEILTELCASQVLVSPSSLTRPEQLQRLMNLSASELELKWLKYAYARGHNLPTHAQVFNEKCQTRPDFSYTDRYVEIYVDGPPHDYPERQQRDAQQQECLEDLGYSVIRFRHDNDWDDLFDSYPNVFGKTAESKETQLDQSESKTDTDLSLFPDSWQLAIEKLMEIPEVQIEPGGDVTADGHVIGRYIAEIALGTKAKALRLLDSSDGSVKDVEEALVKQGYPVVKATPADEDAIEKVRSTLEAIA